MKRFLFSGILISALSVQALAAESASVVSFGLPEESYIAVNKESSIPVTLIVHSENAIEDITYSYTLGDSNGTGSLHFATPLQGNDGVFNVDLNISPVSLTGIYDFNLTLETVNGVANTESDRTVSGRMNVWLEIPETRPLVEEYTGLNCGYCPRGYVALEEMNRRYSDRFVALAYHSRAYESQMVTVVDNNFPLKVNGLPAASVNRVEIIDPAYIPENWYEYSAQVVPTSIDVEAKWADDNRSEIEAWAKVRFATAVPKSFYTLSFALVADNMHHPTWKQSNKYSGQSAGDGIESDLWDIFLKGPSEVTGLIYNDVVAYYKEIKGIGGSIPTSLKEGQEIDYDYYFPMRDVKRLDGTNFLTDDAELHVVAMVLDSKTGRVVNCNKSPNLSLLTTGIKDSAADAEVADTEYFNLQGVRVLNPSEGVYLRVETLRDGTRRTVKEIIR